jgi:site-specific recombinase XerD
LVNSYAASSNVYMIAFISARMHSFFAFCVANGLLRKNPMDALNKPKTPDVVPTDPGLPCTE